MLSGSREEIAAVFDALDADLDRVCELSFDHPGAVTDVNVGQQT